LQPIVWVIQAINKAKEQEDPLTISLQNHQWPKDANPDPLLLELNFEDLISKHLFALEKPPRWIILSSEKQLLLIDRTKWHEKRLLRFNLDEIFGTQMNRFGIMQKQMWASEPFRVKRRWKKPFCLLCELYRIKLS